MAREERLRSKYLYKAVLVMLKMIPMLLALFNMANTVLGFLGIECHWISFFGGVSFLTLTFLYLASYVFQFCACHRMFLHYILVTNILSVIDYEYGIPVSNLNLFRIYVIILGLFLFFVLYLHKHEKLKALSPAND